VVVVEDHRDVAIERVEFVDQLVSTDSVGGGPGERSCDTACVAGNPVRGRAGGRAEAP
jgi:hypothetical protein